MVNGVGPVGGAPQSHLQNSAAIVNRGSVRGSRMASSVAGVFTFGSRPTTIPARTSGITRFETGVCFSPALWMLISVE